MKTLQKCQLHYITINYTEILKNYIVNSNVYAYMYIKIPIMDLDYA